MATQLASGYIDLTVRWKGAFDEIITAAQRAGKEAERQLKRQFQDGIEVEVDADTTEAERKIEKTKREAKQPIKTQLDVDLAEAQKQLTALRIQQEAKKLKVDVEVDTTRATAQLELLRTQSKIRDLTVKVNADTSGAVGSLNVLNRTLENVARSDIFRVGLGVGLLGSIPSVVYGLTEVTASLKELSQAALVLPGILAGVGASFGTLIGGLSGVSDAFEAVVGANKELASGQTGAASAARQAQSAQNSLRSALVNQERATASLGDAYKDARRELEDFQTQMRGGALDAKQAALDVQVAWENLTSGDYTDRRQAVLDYEQALQRQTEVTQDNMRLEQDAADAQSKGIENSDQVVAAKENVASANQQVADAQANVVETTNAVSAAQQKAIDAMGELSPNAQALVTEMVDIQDKLLDLRNNISQTMLGGVPEAVSSLFDEILPHFESGTQKIAARWNELIHETLRVVGTDESKSLIDRVFGNTDEAMARLKPALQPLMDIITTLTGTGSDFLPRIADALTAVTERFANFLTQAQQTGELKRWIDEGLTAIGDLGEIALNIMKVVGAFTDAADGNFLSWLRDVTGEWAEFLNSSRGQQEIKDFLQQGKETLAEWKPVLEAIPGAFMDIVEACRQLLNDYILPLVKFITNDLPGGINTVVGAFALWKGAQVIGAITNLTGLLGDGGLMGKLNGIAGLVRTGGPIALGLAALFTTSKNLYDQMKENDEYARRQADPSIPQEQKDQETTDKFGVGPGELGQIPEPGSMPFEYLVAEVEQGKVALPGVDPKDARAALTKAYADQKNGVAPPTGPDRNGNIPGTQIPWVYPETPEDQVFPGAPGFQPVPSDQQTPGTSSRDRRGLPPAPAPGDGPAPIADAAIPPGSFNTNEFYGLPTGSESIGSIPWIDAIEQYFGVNADTYGGHQEGAGYNQGIDWTGPVENMQRLAEYFASVPQELEQVIWRNPGTGQTIGVADGQAVGPGTSQPGYYAADWAGHEDHVHTRQSSAIPVPGAGTFMGPSGQNFAPSAPNTSGATPVFVVNWPGGTPYNGAITPGGLPGSGGAPGAVPQGGGTSLWDEVAQYESSGNWQNADTGNNGHYGGLQFSPDTWRAYGGGEFAEMPHQATREQQIEIANRTAFTGHNGQAPQGLGAWEVITQGKTPNITPDTPQSAFMPPVSSGQGTGPAPGPAAPMGNVAPTSFSTPPPVAESISPSDPGNNIAGGPVPGVERTEGYKPAAAGHSGASGNSFLSGLYDMGAQAINSTIDQAASAASSAASMGVNAIAPGAGGAAGGAANAAIGMGTSALKRGVQYGADMLGIWTDALIEQVTPFGAPRWISTDPTAFMPSGMTKAMTTSMEKAMGDMFKKDQDGQNPAKPGDPMPQVAPPTVPGGADRGPGGAPNTSPDGGGGPSFNTTNNVTLADQAEFQRYQTDQNRVQVMQYGGRPSMGA